MDSHLEATAGSADPCASTIWILLTPSIDDAAWRRAIEDAIRTFDMLRLDARENDTDRYSSCARYALTQDPADIEDAQHAYLVMPRPETAPTAIALQHGGTVLERIEAASLVLAKTNALSERFPLLTESQIGASAWVELGALKVSVPDRASLEPEDHILRDAFAIYREPTDQQPTKAIWNEALFVYNDRARRDQLEVGDVDVTGAPKLLIFGPYISLPAGEWRAVFRFGVDEDSCKHEFRFDWGTRTECVSQNVRPGKPGFYELPIDWDFQHTEPSEIRVIITEGAFSGTFFFRGISVVDRRQRLLT